MSPARTLALEALNSILEMEDTEANEWDAVERVIPEMCSIARAAVTAIEAETGEPVAWVEPEHLREMHKLANPCWQTLICWTSNNSGSKVPLYVIPQEAAPPPAVPQWLPIETAPKDGTSVLLYCPKSLRVAVTGGFWSDHRKCGCWVAGGYMQKAFPPTHWMPLPGAPA